MTTYKNLFWWLLTVFVWTLVQFRPIDDVDVFTQIRLGQITIDARSLLKTERFSYLHLGSPFWNPGELAQILLAFFFQLGGWLSLKWIFGLFFALAFVIAGVRADQQLSGEGETPRLFSVGAATLLGVLAALSNSSVRPQLIGLISFSAVIFLMDRPNWRRVIVCSVIGIIWQNCHPSLSLGLICIGAGLFGHLLVRRSFGESVACHVVLLIVLSFTQFATPLGAEIFAVSRRNVSVSRDILQITEWLPPWDPAVFGATHGFWLAALITFGFLARYAKRLSIGELLQISVFFILSVYATRFILFWGVVMIPFWTRSFELTLPKRVFGWRGVDLLRPGVFKACVLSAFTLSAAFTIFASPLLDPEIPLSGIDELRKSLSAGRIYNYREWGGPLTLLGEESWKIHIDGRLYLYSDEEWLDYNRAALGMSSVAELTNRYEPAAFFIHDTFHEGLIKQLLATDEWQRVYHQKPLSIFMRRGPG